MSKSVVVTPVTYGEIVFEPEGIIFSASVPVAGFGDEESVTILVTAIDDGSISAIFEWLPGREFGFDSWQKLVEFIQSGESEPTVMFRHKTAPERVVNR